MLSFSFVFNIFNIWITRWYSVLTTDNNDVAQCFGEDVLSHAFLSSFWIQCKMAAPYQLKETDDLHPSVVIFSLGECQGSIFNMHIHNVLNLCIHIIMYMFMHLLVCNFPTYSLAATCQKKSWNNSTIETWVDREIIWIKDVPVIMCKPLRS